MRLSANEKAVLQRLPCSVERWQRVHRKTRESLVKKCFVVEDAFGAGICRAPDTRLPKEEAARFVGEIINKSFFVESHVASQCSCHRREEVAFWNQQYKLADRAFRKVYPDEYEGVLGRR